jgi:hypothetical protein
LWFGQSEVRRRDYKPQTESHSIRQTPGRRSLPASFRAPRIPAQVVIDPLGKLGVECKICRVPGETITP